jgi:ABC-type uncharacterized transport system ATPase subunit
MDRVVFESVRKIFRHRPALFNWLGKERGGETIALKDISFSAARAEVLVLLGPNGSGKTTALKLISTMLLPDAGSVRVGGFDARRDAGEVRRQVGIAVGAERSSSPVSPRVRTLSSSPPSTKSPAAGEHKGSMMFSTIRASKSKPTRSS